MPKKPAGYDAGAFPPFAVTTDLVVLTVREGDLHALLVERGQEPFAGRWALPGGFVKPDEDLESAARRELLEETGVTGHLEQLASFGAPDRDPRMRVVTIAYLALLPEPPEPVADTDASEARFWRVDETPRLAFDHAEILAAGIERARSKLEYSPLATAFCGRMFTLGELRRVYEAVWDVELDPANFRRKVLHTADFVRPTGKSQRPSEAGGRPAELFRAGGATTLHPPMLRPG